MADLKSRADELINSAIDGESAPDWDGAMSCAGCGERKFDSARCVDECANCGGTEWNDAAKPLDSPCLVRKEGSEAALTRFVHALCEAADKLGKSRTWAQHHSNCALLQTFGKCDCGLSEFRPELEAALAALEKGEKA